MEDGFVVLIPRWVDVVYNEPTRKQALHLCRQIKKSIHDHQSPVEIGRKCLEQQAAAGIRLESYGE
jgi:hypothetical protein